MLSCNILYYKWYLEFDVGNKNVWTVAAKDWKIRLSTHNTCTITYRTTGKQPRNSCSGFCRWADFTWNVSVVNRLYAFCFVVSFLKEFNFWNGNVKSNNLILIIPFSSNEVADSDSEDPQVYESMCNIQAQAGSSETAQASDLGNVHSPKRKYLASLSSNWDVKNETHSVYSLHCSQCCFLKHIKTHFLNCGWCSDHPQSAVVSQDEENSEEGVYEYDCPRPVAPPAPIRRNLSDISSPLAAFSTLSIDSAVDASKYFLQIHKLISHWANISDVAAVT